MVGSLLEDQVRTGPRRQNVVLQIGTVGALPDCNGRCDRFIVRQQRVAVKIGSWVLKGRIPQGKEAGHVPVAQHRFFGIEIDREVEEIGDDRNGPAVARERTGLQDIDAFDDQNIGLTDLDPVIGTMS